MRQGWQAHLAERAEHCERLEAVLAQHVFVVTDEHLLDEPECGLAALRHEHARRSQDAAHVYDLLEYSGPPKAVVATGLKRAVASVFAAQDVLAHVHAGAVQTVQAAATHADHNRTRHPRWTGNATFMTEARVRGAECPAPRDDLLRRFLHTRVGYTPQHANLTRVARAVARHLVAVTECQLETARTLARFWECAAGAWNVVVEGTGALAGWELAARALESALQVDEHAERPQAWVLADEVRSVADAAVTAMARTSSATVVTDAIKRYHEGRTAAVVARRWLDTLCCGFVGPAPLVDAPFDGCVPAHHA